MTVDKGRRATSLAGIPADLRVLIVLLIWGLLRVRWVGMVSGPNILMDVGGIFNQWASRHSLDIAVKIHNLALRRGLLGTTAVLAHEVRCPFWSPAYIAHWRSNLRFTVVMGPGSLRASLVLNICLGFAWWAHGSGLSSVSDTALFHCSNWL